MYLLSKSKKAIGALTHLLIVTPKANEQRTSFFITIYDKGRR